MNARPLKPNLVRTEENLRRSEFFGAKLNNLTVGQVVDRYVFLLFLGVLLVDVSVGRHVALHFLDFLDYFKFSSCMEYIPTPSQQQLEVLGDVSTTNVNSLNGVVDREAFKHGATVSHTVAAVKHQSGGHSSGVKRKYCLLLEKDFGGAELLEEDVGSLNPILVGVEGGLGEQDWVLLGRNLQLVEAVAPESLHVVPVLNNAVLDGIIQL